MFTAQSAALNKVASRNVKVLVVGNSAAKTAATPASPAWKWMIVPGQRWAKRSRS
jgi:hypothetical protein